MKSKKIRIEIEISARHIHISRKDLDKIYGKNHELKPFKYLSQIGEFASKETVSLLGPKGRIDGVRIIGPVRDYTQVEVSATELRKLGIEAPVRMSGDLKNSGSIKILGPSGMVRKKDGLVMAHRHIHCSPKDSKRLGLRPGKKYAVEVKGERGLVFSNVLVKTNKLYEFRMHIDTDEANAAGISKKINNSGFILK